MPVDQHTSTLTDQAAQLLVVDDDPSARLLTGETLRQAGFQVLEAANGTEALATLNRSPVDAVLLDLDMPGMDGYAVCRAIRSNPQRATLPVMVITGAEETESVAAAFSAGATEFITKPLHWPSLPYRVRYLLRGAQLTAELMAVLAASPDTVFRVRSDGTVLPAMDVAHGGDAGMVKPYIGRKLQDILPAEVVPRAEQNLQQALAGRAKRLEFQLDLPEVGLVDLEGQFAPVSRDEVFVYIRDVSGRRRAEAQIRYLAYFDELTALPNRQSFNKHLARNLERVRGEQRSMALLFLDLDRFKRINDTLGHSIGDQLLQHVARELRGCLRAQDYLARSEEVPKEAEPDVARLGGDEFTVVLTDVRGPDDAARVARRVIERLARPVTLDGHEVVVTPSIGIAMGPEDGETPETLVRNADAAMYHAKQLGRNNFQFYQGFMNERALERLHLEEGLRKAVELEQLVLHYQPQYNLATGRMLGVEALVRWQHPELGLVSPATFIPLAEETGLIVDIGHWVLRRACDDLAALQAQLGLSLRLAVNLAVPQFQDPELLPRVRAALDDSGLPDGGLELEITENALIGADQRVTDCLAGLRAMGISLAIDDFGTGYSSLSYLKRFPIDVLKIDRSFVTDLDTDVDDQAIVKAVVAMGKALGLQTVAEGVETLAHAAALGREGVDVGQGFLWSRPLPLAQLRELLADGQGGVAPARDAALPLLTELEPAG